MMETNTSVDVDRSVAGSAKPAATRPTGRSRSPFAWRRALWGYLLIAPAFVFVAGFTLFPVVGAFGISLTEWDLLTPMTFSGADNYQKVLTDPVARKTLLNTFSYTVLSVPLGLILSLLLALLLNQKIRGMSFFRTAYYLPVVSSTVAVSVIFRWILDAKYGLLNQGLGLLGIPAIPWLTSPRWAMFGVIIVSVWRSIGFTMLILLAALQDVPKDMYEAAEIDGATPFQRFVSITVPLVTPAIFFVTITGVINSFQSFDLVYNMTKGGPARSTYLIGYYIYEQAFKYLHMGYGAALAFVLFFFVLAFTVLQWVLRRRWVFGEE